VRGGVVAGNRGVGTAADDIAGADHNGADGDFARSGTRVRQA
jgi:hypothetical protein